jgi:excisionase family DNA binding protein
MDPADILTPTELAERLKTSHRWVFEMTRKRQRNLIPHYKIGRYLRFNWKEVCDWLETTKEGNGKNAIRRVSPLV